ncbi:hypothetical protein A5320_14510 [Rheinheimera sp. SA_1]|jgi:hypothetical protein|uniref:DUF1826 domain-containing protein n=1 Tax=Rheinheimera sp. SA_1 TaxID=1827365 RepID=UPI0007FD53DE|nr:DUF1826 domain-containing protein [Rheinheimera sp. SA_1]OBP13885.1 hypothetical protein A5320_14510 [Rheinheimera sp. SA_1]
MPAAFQLLPAMQQRQSDNAEVLTEIFEPTVNMVIWQRQPDPAVESYSQYLVAASLQASGTTDFLQLQAVVEPAELPALLAQKLPDAPGKTEFIADLQLLSQMLTCLMDCSAVGFRLKLLQQAMCPRFHTDHVALRLLVTYVGAGTEWLNQAQSPGLYRQLQIPQQLRPAEVALLKGSAWQGNGAGAIWHRSPESTAPRLLVSLDPVGD